MYEKILLSSSKDFGLFIGKELKRLNITKTDFANIAFMDIRNIRKLTNGYRKIISIEDRIFYLNLLKKFSDDN